jgi:hypothetical protein
MSPLFYLQIVGIAIQVPSIYLLWKMWKAAEPSSPAKRNTLIAGLVVGTFLANLPWILRVLGF